MDQQTIFFKVAEARRKDLIEEAKRQRKRQARLERESNLSEPRFTLAVIGTTLAAVLVGLVT